ncbi:MAG TPA: hypothetical protein PLN56_06725 [Methanoregulaceae archaeon]|nr:MAG: hypothetical protein IPI71_07100 [Methanolinea sp.]HON81929.1 hypothetical protein [Methanoregulaceae archaeon]HPD10673.1 hypothetical protein [Methanoregulaceae archaeon]HRT15802.1 hypothetical protein [Methanoregulaceae archaeon]HRU31316.1 hypothetical protein [Methanoregulaceae archaeon]
MVTESFRSALELLRTPAAWLPGIASGFFCASFIFLQFFSGIFIAERLWILEMLVFPFFVAGLMHLVKTGERSLSAFISGGTGKYFRVLLPSLIIFFWLILTLILLFIPLALLGVAETAFVFVVMSTSFTVLLFTFFYDAAAIIEERKVFDAIRRSAEFVLQQTRACMVFYLIALAIFFSAFFLTLLAWTAALYERLEPLATMSAVEIQSFSPSRFNELLGYNGILVTAFLAFIAVTMAVSLIYSFKACFFRDHAGTPTAVTLQGEYDEKGRWFKY